MEKNPTLSFKIGGILGKKNQIPHWQQALFFVKKIISDFAETSLMISLQQINVPQFGKNVKKKLCRKKIRLQVSKSGVFWGKKSKIPQVAGTFFARKSSLFFRFFFRNKVEIEKICRILENLQKTFFYWKNIRLQISKWGVFCDQKRFSDFFFLFLEIKFR